MSRRRDSYQRHLVEHVGEYYPDLSADRAPVRLVEVRDGKSSEVFRFAIGCNGTSRHILIKRPKTDTARYRMAAQTDIAVKSRLEYEGLLAIEEHFRNLSDDRFRALRALGFIEHDAALVVEELSGPSLLKLFLSVNRFPFSRRTAELDPPFRNAGSWLCEYHRLPARSEVEIHDDTRQAFESAVRESATYLGGSLGKAAYFDDLAERTITRARQVLPEQLPIGLKHGDYAMRNLLVAPNGSVAGFDTQAKWRVPIYDDIALFVIELEANWRQVLSNGLAFRASTLERYRQQFVQGYFEADPVPEESINLFMIKSMLHRWSAHIYRMAGLQRDGKITLRRVMLPVSNHFFQRYLSALDRQAPR